MFEWVYNILIKWNQFFAIWMHRIFNLLPIFEVFMGLSLIIIRIIFNEITENEYYFKYESPFYDTASMMSFLICLEHIYVCYYLIIIIIMVYWFLYLCIVDFSGWTLKNKNIGYVLINKLIKIHNLWNKICLYSYKYIYTLILIIYENNYLYLNINKIISFNIVDYNRFIKIINYLKLIKINKNNLNNLNFTFDILGRNYLIFNQEEIKDWKLLNIIIEFINIIQKDINILNELYIKKYFNKYLYYTKPKLFDFFQNLNIILYLNNKKNQKVTINYIIINLRTMYKEIFLTNQFKHSGIFEIIWAIFPTFIIICILIPSLILLYSFEDILSPKLSIKVIANQWYWTYEFDNWIQYKQINNENINKYYNNFNKNNNNFIKNLNHLNATLINYANNIINPTNKIWKDVNFLKYKTPCWNGHCYYYAEWLTYYRNHKFGLNVIEMKDAYLLDIDYNNEIMYINNNYKNYYNIVNEKNYINKNIFTHYSYNSVIIPQENLIFGTKRLLEVDNRLILPTNMTIRFLITSADVLHAFAMPELGFKVDAVPGRINQILVFINRPGIFYGQCSELCGTNHAFMPIVIQSVLPEIYLNYLESIQNKIDLN